MKEFTYEHCSYRRTKVGTYSRNDCCTMVSCRPPSWCFRFSWSPGFPLRLLGSLMSSCFVCGVAPNQRILRLICEFSTATACGPCLIFVFHVHRVQLRSHCDTLCPLTVCTCTPCRRASYISKTDSFLWGHDPDTLACKARPSFDGCGTSLSVSLSLSLHTWFEERNSNIVLPRHGSPGLPSWLPSICDVFPRWHKCSSFPGVFARQMLPTAMV